MKSVVRVAPFLLFLCFSFPLVAQCLDGNCSYGRGTYKYTSGAKYSGDFKSGKRHGKGTLYYTNGNMYEGDWSNDYREGYGRLKFKSGDVFTGYFKQNRFHGTGSMLYANGDIYGGNWSGDLPNGRGTYTFKSGKKYEGDFVNGKFHGNGKMTYSDKSVFSGSWNNNLREGQGTLSKADGSKVTGYWASDVYQGKTATTAAQTSPAPPAPKWRNCTETYCASGLGAYYYGDGSHYEGEFAAGVPQGKGKCYYANGDIYEGGFSNHAPHGQGVMRFKNGRIANGYWDYGKWVGLNTAPSQKPGDKVPVDVNSTVKIWAVLVGVSRYTAMPSLKYSDDDAYQMYAFLKSPEGGALPEPQIKVLVDDDATRANILDQMRKTLLRADDNDVILFYFSGHGIEGAFLPSDFDGFYNQLRHDDIKKVLLESKAKHKICIADACHAGTLLAAKAPEASTVQKLYGAFEDSKGGLALLMSSKAEEYSLEDHGLRSGIFSYYIIKGLQGEADTDKNSIVTVKELYTYVYHRVRTYTSNAQTPVITGQYDPNMPVAVTK